MAAPVTVIDTATALRAHARGRRFLRAAGAVLAAASLLLAADGAHAQRRKKKPAKPPAAATSTPPAASADAKPAPPAPVAPPVVPRRPRAAVSRIVDALARDLERAPAGALVVAGPLTSDTAAPRGASLVVSIAAQLAGRRGAGSWARGEPAALPLAREAARNESALIYLTSEIAAGQLRVTADVYPVPKTVWSRVREPEPGPAEHTFAQSPVDAEVRSFLAPIPLVTVSVNRAKNFESDVVALACGDLNQDGALEIVSVSRRRVSTVRLTGGKVAPILSRAWPDLVQVSPAPLREPIGFATLVERERPGDEKGEVVDGAFVDVALTDRARSVRLDGKLQVAAVFPGLALPDGGSTVCCKNPGLVITGAVVPCMPADPTPLLATVGGQYDAMASAELISPRGEPYVVWAGRERGMLEVRDSAGTKQISDSSGAQLAVGDLDQDGEPEIITSIDTLNPLEDAVVVRSWSRGASGAKLRERFRLPAAAGVRALAVCPPDGPGRSPFVVATADEIWVVR